jgi:hypothetical protein
MEGTVDRGRTHEVRIAAEGRREHGLVVPRVRHANGVGRLFKERGLPARYTPSWTAMAWWLGNVALAPKPKAPLYHQGLFRILCGVPTTRASSCWGIKDIAIHLPFPTTPAVIFCSAKPWSQ